jgi:hypothetical protein
MIDDAALISTQTEAPGTDAPPDGKTGEKIATLTMEQFAPTIPRLLTNYNSGKMTDQDKAMAKPAYDEILKIAAEGGADPETAARRIAAKMPWITVKFPEAVAPVQTSASTKGAAPKSSPSPMGAAVRKWAPKLWDVASASPLENSLWSVSGGMEKVYRSIPLIPHYDKNKPMDFSNAAGAYGDLQAGFFIGANKAIGGMATPLNAGIAYVMSKLPGAKALALALPVASDAAKALKVLNLLDAGAHGWFAGGAGMGLINSVPELKVAWESGDPLTVGKAAAQILVETGILGQMGLRSYKAGKAVGTGVPVGVSAETLTQTADKLEGNGKPGRLSKLLGPNMQEQNLKVVDPTAETAVYPLAPPKWVPLVPKGPQVVTSEAIPRLRALAEQARTGTPTEAPPTGAPEAAPENAPGTSASRLDTLKQLRIQGIEARPVSEIQAVRASVTSALAALDKAIAAPLAPSKGGGILKPDAIANYAKQAATLTRQKTQYESAARELDAILAEKGVSAQPAVAAPDPLAPTPRTITSVNPPPPAPVEAGASPVPEVMTPQAKEALLLDAVAGPNRVGQIGDAIILKQRKLAEAIQRQDKEQINTLGQTLTYYKNLLKSAQANPVLSGTPGVRPVPPPEPPPAPAAPTPVAPAPAAPQAAQPKGAVPIIQVPTEASKVAAPQSKVGQGTAPAAQGTALDRAVAGIAKSLPPILGGAAAPLVRDWFKQPMSDLQNKRAHIASPEFKFPKDRDAYLAGIDQVIKIRESAAARAAAQPAAAPAPVAPAAPAAAPARKATAGAPIKGSALAEQVLNFGNNTIEQLDSQIALYESKTFRKDNPKSWKAIAAAAKSVRDQKLMEQSAPPPREIMAEEAIPIPDEMAPGVEPPPVPVIDISKKKARAAPARAPGSVPVVDVPSKKAQAAPVKAEAVAPAAVAAEPELKPTAPLDEAPAPIETGPIEYPPVMLNVYDKLSRIPQEQVDGKQYKRLDKRLTNLAEKYRLDLPRFLADQRALQQQAVAEAAKADMNSRGAEDRAGSAPAEASEGQGVPTTQPTITPATTEEPAESAPPVSGAKNRKPVPIVAPREPRLTLAEQVADLDKRSAGNAPPRRTEGGGEALPPSSSKLKPLTPEQMKSETKKLQEEWGTGPKPPSVEETLLLDDNPIRVAMRDTAAKLKDPKAAEDMANELSDILFGKLKRDKDGNLTRQPKAGEGERHHLGDTILNQVEQIDRIKKENLNRPAVVQALDNRRQVLLAGLEEYATREGARSEAAIKALDAKIAAGKAEKADSLYMDPIVKRRALLQSAIDRTLTATEKPPAPAMQKGAFEEEYPPSLMDAFKQMGKAKTDAQFDAASNKFDAEAERLGWSRSVAYDQAQKLSSVKPKKASKAAEPPPKPVPTTLVPGTVYESRVNNKGVGLVKGQLYKFRAKVGEAGSIEPTATHPMSEKATTYGTAGTSAYEFWPVDAEGKLGTPVRFINPEPQLMKVLKPAAAEPKVERHPVVRKPGERGSLALGEVGSAITGVADKALGGVLRKIDDITRGAIKIDKDGKIDIGLPEPLRTIAAIKEAMRVAIDQRRKQQKGDPSWTDYVLDVNKGWPPPDWMDLATFDIGTLRNKFGERVDKYWTMEERFGDQSWVKKANVWTAISNRIGISEGQARAIEDAMSPAAPSRKLIDSLPVDKLERLRLEVQADLALQIGLTKAWDLVNHKTSTRGGLDGWDAEWGPFVKAGESEAIAGEIASSLKQDHVFIQKAIRDIVGSGDLSRLSEIAKDMGPRFFTYMRNFPELAMAIGTMADKAVGGKSTLENLSETGLSRRDFGKITGGAVASPLVKLEAKKAIDKVADQMRGQFPGMGVRVEEVPGKEVVYDYYEAPDPRFPSRTIRFKTEAEAQKTLREAKDRLLKLAESQDEAADMHSKLKQSRATFQGVPIAQSYKNSATSTRKQAEGLRVKKTEERIRFGSDAAVEEAGDYMYEGFERPGSRKDVKLVKVIVPKDRPTAFVTTDAITGKEKLVPRTQDDSVLDVTADEMLDPKKARRASSAYMDTKYSEADYSDLVSGEPILSELDNKWTGRLEEATSGIAWTSKKIQAKRMQAAHDYIDQRIADIKAGKVKTGQPSELKTPAEARAATEAPPKLLSAPASRTPRAAAEEGTPPAAAAVAEVAPAASRRDWMRKFMPRTETPPKR